VRYVFTKRVYGWVSGRTRALMFASILVSQRWLAAIVGILISVWLYMEIPKEEKGLQIRFGDDYKRYMQKVPKLNPLVGVIRLLRRRDKDG